MSGNTPQTPMPEATNRLFVTSLLVWALWPAVFVAVFRDASSDFVGAWLKDHFLYPPSLVNIVENWMKAEPPWKLLYLSVWYVNSLLVGCRYAVYLICNPRSRAELKAAGSPLWLALLGIFGLAMPVVMYSELLFDSGGALSTKERFLLETSVGLYLGLPFIYLAVACAPFGALELLVSAGRKLFLNLPRGQK